MHPVIRQTALALSALLAFIAVGSTTARTAHSQAAPVVETIVPFDSAGRLTVLTPTLVSRLKLSAPEWPVTGSFAEAQLFLSSKDGYVLVSRLGDGSVYRYQLSDAAVAALKSVINSAIVAQGKNAPGVVGTGTGLVVSQPAGNTFVRNQTLLGLVAYGPATAAMLSNSSGGAAAGGYFLAAGTSFFVAANIARQHTVTRAQAARAAHGGSRGAISGLALGYMYGANTGPERGAPVLAGAIAGTIIGYRHARGLTDGEAASAGLFADLGALTTIGLAGTVNAFEERKKRLLYNPSDPNSGYYETNDGLAAKGRAALGVALGAEALGYALGPRYARRAAYNVTSGDVTTVFTSALLGGVTASAINGENGRGPARFAVATGGLLLGAFAADRGLVRKADRTAADGVLIQLGALAGGLIGGGLVTMADGGPRGVLAAAGVGGALGLLAADNIIKPAKDAGPLRGIMQTSSRASEGRVQLSLGPVSTLRISF